jgi:hypothetical protein
MSMRTALTVLAMLSLSCPAIAAECRAHSGPNTAALVELYTSEGCDSCPPADRWLSAFAARAPSPLVVPIAFHVDYWDDLGWKDAYAEARHTRRQREFARITGARAMFTPQVVLSGRDFAWRSGDSSKALEAIQSKAARANLELVSEGPSSARVRATLAPGVRGDDLVVNVAMTQNGIATEVKAGENRGETLHHDFVVRDMATERRWSHGEVPSIDSRIEFRPRGDWKPERMSVVAFVQDAYTGEVLQALSTPVCTR